MFINVILILLVLSWRALGLPYLTQLMFIVIGFLIGRGYQDFKNF